MNFRRLYFLSFFFPLFFVSTETFAQEPETSETPLDSLLNIKVRTAAKYWQTVSEAPAAVTIITSRDIERFGYRTLAEALSSVRGFYTSYDRNYVYVGVRGFSPPSDYNDRILLSVNGHSFNEPVFGSAPVGTDFVLDLESVERIEIVRGSGSALYGTGAMFAVVNVITKDGNTVDGGKFGIETGSNNHFHTTSLFGNEEKNGFDLFVSLQTGDSKGHDIYFQEYDSPATHNGVAENRDWDKYYGLFTSFSYTDLSVQGMVSSREKGVPTGAYSSIFNSPDTRTLDEHNFIEVQYEHELGSDKSIMMKSSYDHYEYEDVFPYYLLRNSGAADGNWWTGEARFRWDPFVNNRLTVGIEYKDNFLSRYRSSYVDTAMNVIQYFSGNFPFTLFSFYAQNEFQVRSNLSLTLGLREDKYSTVGSSFTPRAALIYNFLKSSTLKLLYGEGFRAPNIFETNYQDTYSITKSNSALLPEKIRTEEIILEQRLDEEWFAVFSAYRYRINDLINQVVDPADSMLQYRNVTTIDAIGFEGELSAKLKNGMRGYLSYSRNEGEDVTGIPQDLINLPEHLFKSGISYNVTQSFFISTEFRYESKRTTAAHIIDNITVPSVETGPFFLTGIHCSMTPHLDEVSPLSSTLNRIEIGITINNLFNATYTYPAGNEHRQTAITQDGRNFLIKLEYKF